MNNKKYINQIIVNSNASKYFTPIYFSNKLSNSFSKNKKHSTSEKQKKNYLKYFDNINTTISEEVINSLKKKIIRQKKIISYLNLKLDKYYNKSKEMEILLRKIDRMKEIQKEKDKIIEEHQKLTQVAKEKFELCYNKNKKLGEKDEILIDDCDELRKQNEDILKRISLAEEEKEKIKNEIENEKEKNKNEVEKMRNDIEKTQEKYDIELKRYKDLEEKNKYIKKEISNLKSKLFLYDKYENDLSNLKKKYSILESENEEKDNKIKELTTINDNLNNKLEISNDNYNKILAEQKILQEKLSSHKNSYRMYEKEFRKISSEKPKDNEVYLSETEGNLLKLNPIFNKVNKVKIVQNYKRGGNPYQKYGYRNINYINRYSNYNNYPKINSVSNSRENYRHLNGSSFLSSYRPTESFSRPNKYKYNRINFHNFSTNK